VSTIWLDTALDDLERLSTYIDEHQTGNAQIVLERIFSSVRTLDAFPRRGRAGRLVGTYELVVPRTPYVVMYRIVGENIEILQVIHGAREWPSDSP